MILKAEPAPITDAPTSFGLSTIERWYYAARDAVDPVAKLKNRLRKDAGEHPSLGLALRQALRAQYREHKSWTYHLHYSNLRALAEMAPELGRVPSYEVVRRWMKSQGLCRQRRIRHRQTAGVQLAEKRLETREVRSYEVEYVGDGKNLDQITLISPSLDLGKGSQLLASQRHRVAAALPAIHRPLIYADQSAIDYRDHTQVTDNLSTL